MPNTLKKEILTLAIAVLLATTNLRMQAQDRKHIMQEVEKAAKREQFAEIIPLLKPLVANDSSDSKVLFYMALAMSRTGDYHGCLKYSTRGMAVDSTYAAHPYRRGDCNLALENYQEAIRDYTKALEVGPNVESYFNRAIARAMSNDPKGCIEDFTIVLAVNRKDPEGYYGRAQCYEDAGDTLMALADLDKAVALKSKNPDIFNERGYLRFRRKDFMASKADYMKCVELDPAYVPAHLALAEISLIFGEWSAAYQHASNATTSTNDTHDSIIGLLFKCAANKLMDKNTSEDEAMLDNALKDLQERSWEFSDIQRSLKEPTLPEAKRTYISHLIEKYYGSNPK